VFDTELKIPMLLPNCASSYCLQCLTERVKEIQMLKGKLNNSIFDEVLNQYVSRSLKRYCQVYMPSVWNRVLNKRSKAFATKPHYNQLVKEEICKLPNL